MTKVEAIKKKLARYRDEDFLNNFFLHFQNLRDSQARVMANFPWCCFLALKWKYETHSKNNEPMAYVEFIKLINRIYDLQVEASNLIKGETLFLDLRRMMVNQLLYQATDKFVLNSLVRQYIWYCDNSNSYYSDEFKKSTGLELKNYYKMAFYFHMLFMRNRIFESELIPAKIFIVHLVPLFGVEQVKKFIEFSAIKPLALHEFISQYKYNKIITLEYFEDTPMVYKPLIHDDRGMITLCKSITKNGFISLVPEFFKSRYREQYKVHFGKTLEKYVSSILDINSYDYLSESYIKTVYKKHKIQSKSVDFIIKQNDGCIFVDCKAIEPTIFIKASNNTKILKEKLESSFIKGIFQGQECACSLNKINGEINFNNKTMIIVVHRDHYISNAKEVEHLIHPNLEDEIVSNLGEVYIPLDRIYYMTIDEFEYLLSGCRAYDLTINQFMDVCSRKDSQLETKKANVSLHMSEIFVNGVADLDTIISAQEEMINEITNVIMEGCSVWGGKLEEYINIKNYILQ
ncbi:hypothetical protein SNN58_004585 [Cronobacter dublinensis]|nr:hypothetical protein [Cronobacter dublinensis]ELY4486039.1 hypothetical protein [Cronobacter dublinensis]ELY5825964.1 hypothetical protein [Cronobacter dublinensis]